MLKMAEKENKYEKKYVSFKCLKRLRGILQSSSKISVFV